MRRGNVRAREAVAARPVWVGWALLASVLAAAAAVGPAFGQSVPEVVRPRSDAPALPPGVSDGPGTRPRSENPLVEGGVRPIPDSGVVAPPTQGLGSTPVIKPPTGGTMPVIPPPGAPGGDRSVVPK